MQSTDEKLRVRELPKFTQLTSAMSRIKLKSLGCKVCRIFFPVLEGLSQKGDTVDGMEKAGSCPPTLPLGVT